MKKFIFLLSFTCISILGFSQNSTPEPLTYLKVIPFENLSKEELYQKTKLWIASVYPSAAKVIQVDDPSQNLITLRTNIKYSYGKLHMISYDGWINFNIIIQNRDGRSRMQITNIIHENKPGNAQQSQVGLVLNTENQFVKGANKKFQNMVCKDITEKMKIESEILFKEYEDFIKNNNAISTDDDW